MPIIPLEELNKDAPPEDLEVLRRNKEAIRRAGGLAVWLEKLPETIKGYDRYGRPLNYDYDKEEWERLQKEGYKGREYEPQVIDEEVFERTGQINLCAQTLASWVNRAEAEIRHMSWRMLARKNRYQCFYLVWLNGGLVNFFNRKAGKMQVLPLYNYQDLMEEEYTSVYHVYHTDVFDHTSGTWGCMLPGLIYTWVGKFINKHAPIGGHRFIMCHMVFFSAVLRPLGYDPEYYEIVRKLRWKKDELKKLKIEAKIAETEDAWKRAKLELKKMKIEEELKEYEKGWIPVRPWGLFAFIDYVIFDEEHRLWPRRYWPEIAEKEDELKEKKKELKGKKEKVDQKKVEEA
ncbi:MAG: hypothetical protein ACXQS7_00930, partial [Candidatus Syntropharchaeia archaeon]